MTAWLRLQGEANSVALGAKKIDLIPMSSKILQALSLAGKSLRGEQGEDEAG